LSCTTSSPATLSSSSCPASAESSISRRWVNQYLPYGTAWMDRIQLGEEPLLVFKTINCFFVFKFDFFMLTGQPSCKGFRDRWQPSGAFVSGCRRVLATLLTNFLEGVGNCWNWHNFSLCCQHPFISCQWESIALWDS
jgi:hypothetical protein